MLRDGLHMLTDGLQMLMGGLLIADALQMVMNDYKWFTRFTDAHRWFTDELQMLMDGLSMDAYRRFTDAYGSLQMVYSKTLSNRREPTFHRSADPFGGHQAVRGIVAVSSPRSLVVLWACSLAVCGNSYCQPLSPETDTLPSTG